MSLPRSNAPNVRFGSYELDPSAERLLKEGIPLRLQPQPFRVLLLLTSRPGQVVSREEIRRHLWGDSTFVDFERGINFSVNQIRAALRDSAERPRYIETLPRLGYRFIGALEPPDVQHVGSAPPVGSNLTTRTGDDSQSDPRTARSWGQHWKVAFHVIPVALLVVLVLGGVFYYRLRQGSRLTEQDSIVIGDFANSTGDAVFDDTLKTALTVSLRQSPFLNVLSDDQVSKNLSLMTRPASTKLTPEVTRELCQRAGSKAYLSGAIGSLGSEYVVGLKAVNCQSGDTLAQEQVTARSKDMVLTALGEASARLRYELGESLATVQKLDTPLVQATTSSLDALKAYSVGRRVNVEKGSTAALPYDLRAIELDPHFALGYNTLGLDYANLNEPGRANQYFTQAFRLREHASERERLMITAHYYTNVTGELDRGAQTFQQLIEIYPREAAAYVGLAVLYASRGQYEKAAEIDKQALILAPTRVDVPANLAHYALALQHFEEAQQIASDSLAQNKDDFYFHNILYALAFLRSDPDDMSKQQQWYTGKPQFENMGLALAADTEGYNGHLKKARELTQRAVASAIRADNKESGATWLAIAAQREAAYGNTNEARRSAAAALTLAPASAGVAAEAALAFALAGETTTAASVTQVLEKRLPLDTQMQSLWLPAIETQIALKGKKSNSAIIPLQNESSIEFGQVWFVINISCLYPSYVGGEALLATGRGNAAAAEFRKIVDHSGIVWNCWTGALAQLGLARAIALEAQNSRGMDADAGRARALAAYEHFLALWQDADPDIPIVRQARAEYQRLGARYSNHWKLSVLRTRSGSGRRFGRNRGM